MNVLSHLGCDKVFDYFEKICDIPHGSFHEKALSDYIVSFAKERGLYCRQDNKMNVLIKKGGTAGYESSPVLIMQGHIDMVCDKNEDTEHDFLTEPLEIYIDGDDIKARGTTLGADNGIAAAYMLALLDAEDIAHPPLECIFTVEEEIGMGGATDFDAFDLEGKRFLNMDTEEEGHLMVSCCGGRRMRVYLPIEKEKKQAGTTLSVHIRGLKGGHSGSDIHLQRASANVLLGRFLFELRERVDFALVSANGGNMDNAICREAEAVVVVAPEQVQTVAAVIEEAEAMFREEYKDRESDILMTAEQMPEAAEVLTTETRDYVIALLRLLPYGVQTMDTNMDGLVETSSNIGILFSLIMQCAALWKAERMLSAKRLRFWAVFAVQRWSACMITPAGSITPILRCCASSRRSGWKNSARNPRWLPSMQVWNVGCLRKKSPVWI